MCPDVANPGSTFIYHQIAYAYFIYIQYIYVFCDICFKMIRT